MPSLALRPATAVKEIQALIAGPVDQIEAGGKLLEPAASTMRAAVDGIQRVSEVAAAITTAGRAQSQGIHASDHAIAQMDEIARRSADLLKEAGAGAKSLPEPAIRLANAVNSCKVCA